MTVADPLLVPAGPTAVFVPLERLVAFTRPVYGGDSWEELVAWMLQDRYESRTVAALVEQLEAHGRFRNPVIVEDGWVANGTHRVVAAIVADAAGLHVAAAPAASSDDAERLEVTFTVTLDEPSVERDELFDAVFSALRSFPHGDEWIECDGFSARGHVITAVWQWPLERAEELCRAIVAQSNRFGMTVDISAVARGRLD